MFSMRLSKQRIRGGHNLTLINQHFNFFNYENKPTVKKGIYQCIVFFVVIWGIFENLSSVPHHN